MYVELRRHSTKQGVGNADLSEEGMALATTLGQEQLKNQGFTHFFVSPVKRTQQTLELFAQGAGDFGEVTSQLFLRDKNPLSSEEALHLWEGICHTAEAAGEDMITAAIEKAPEVTHELARQAAQAFRQWTSTIPDDAKVLVVNHSPAIEILVLGLTGETIKQLQPCEGVKLSIRGEEISFEEIRLS